MENKTFSIEIDGAEILWFESSDRQIAYATFQKICHGSQYAGKDVSLINVKTETELGHKFARKAG